jgi:hypothetical protein
VPVGTNATKSKAACTSTVVSGLTDCPEPTFRRRPVALAVDDEAHRSRPAPGGGSDDGQERMEVRRPVRVHDEPELLDPGARERARDDTLLNAVEDRLAVRATNVSEDERCRLRGSRRRQICRGGRLSRRDADRDRDGRDCSRREPTDSTDVLASQAPSSRGQQPGRGGSGRRAGPDPPFVQPDAGTLSRVAT